MTRPQLPPPGVGEGPFLGSREASERLGVTERTILRWAEDGTLPTAWTTKGGHRRFTVAAIDELGVQEADPAAS